MTTPLIPQEIYLLERYTSLESLEQVRDAWRVMLDYVEVLLDHFMRKLPPDYRHRPLPEQPDIVWGERVLPNFRDTMNYLEDACIKRAAGDFEALGRVVGVTGDIRGQGDYWPGWMKEVLPEAEDKYYDLLHRAGFLAKPIHRTISGIWSPGDLTTRYHEILSTLPLSPPPSWPVYRLNTQVKVKSGERTPVTGFYLPDVDNSFPTLLIKSDDELAGEANEAYVGKMFSPDGYLSCTWTLIERIADSGGGIPGKNNISGTDARVQRVPGGQACPVSGWWYTPAAKDSRRYFNQGDTLPSIEGSSYGDTYWLWDANQNSPKL